jgi:hypothetical protein
VVHFYAPCWCKFFVFIVTFLPTAAVKSVVKRLRLNDTQMQAFAVTKGMPLWKERVL